MNPIKLSLSLLLFSIMFQTSAQKNYSSFCSGWYFFPELYNNHVNDSTRVRYWENYWYYRPDTMKFIPDTLQIIFFASPMMANDAYPNNTIERNTVTIVGLFQYKYGLYMDSYTLINPKLSNKIVMFSKSIDLVQLRIEMTNNNIGGYAIDTSQIPIKSILKSNCINIEDSPLNEQCPEVQFLNQLIFNLYIINEQGINICNYESIIPINGSYEDDNCCK